MWRFLPFFSFVGTLLASCPNAPLSPDSESTQAVSHSLPSRILSRYQVDCSSFAHFRRRYPIRYSFSPVLDNQRFHHLSRYHSYCTADSAFFLDLDFYLRRHPLRMRYQVGFLCDCFFSVDLELCPFCRWSLALGPRLAGPRSRFSVQLNVQLALVF